MQSEIQKKWKRWKLGRNIEEEYRHTYSQPSHTKNCSMVTNVSQLPHLPDITATSGLACTPEEKHSLVVSCHNGMSRRKASGPFPAGPPPREGVIGRGTPIEDISPPPPDRVRRYQTPVERAESHP